MKLARRLTLSLLAAMVAVLVAYSSVSIREQMLMFESDSWRDHEVLGRALASSAAALWKAEGVASAIAVVNGARAGETELRASWHFDDERRRGTSGLTEHEWAAVDAGQEIHRLHGNELVSAFPVRQDGVLAAVVINESLAARDALFRRAVRDTGLTVLGLLAVWGALASKLGAWLVGRPVHVLVDQARRIGRVDLSKRLPVERDDELGELSVEMNAMVDELEQAHARVEAESSARLRALEQLRHADRLTTVGKLASGVAHELGTPLNVVFGRARMIARGQVSGEAVPENARIIVQQTERMTHIIRQLLDFARARAPKDAMVDLGALVTRVVDLLAPLAKKRAVSLVPVLEVGPHGTRGDRAELEQVLTNLIVNAVHAMTEPGDVEIRLRRVVRAPPSDLGTGEAPWIAVSVKDTGVGISSDDAARVFEPFFTTKDVGEGTGLGLSVAYGIVREHGGFIDLSTRPGAGATFTVFLPAEDA